VSAMDRDSLEIVELPPPSDENLRARLEPGAVVEYWVILGRRMINQVRRE